MRFKSALFAAAAAVAFSAVSAPALAQEQEDESSRTLDTVVTVGTRVANRSALDTAAPVDVVSAETIQNMGVGELNQALAVNLPSYNFPRPALADGTDSVRPAALRGLAPDQTLVLVNGKRRHSAALVNVNGTIGRGASAVDLNTIPSLAVGGVEVLRDGASALYGSDAIAGVVNVRLREANSGGAVQASYGWRETEYTVPVNAPTAAGVPNPGPEVTRERSDGHILTVAGWKGYGLGEDGFITVTGEYKDQNNTERSGYDSRQQYPGVFPEGEAIINRFNAWTGEPELEQLSFFANAGYTLENGVELYGWGSFQDRETVSAGFYRRANDARNVIEIYPNGFLPKINPTTTDMSALGGARFNWAGWDVDASLGYGSNKMEFQIIDTLNRSIGPSSKTSFDAGGFETSQLVANIGFVKGYAMDGLASDLNVAWGVEARQETYEIFAGEPDSYRNGGVLLNGNPTASGSQVFPGFRPENEQDEDRTAIGAYLDVEANVTDALLLSGALRGESYSDFGETLTGKLAARYDFTESFAIRGSIQNGFRAPSLQQQFFTTTSTNFINGVPFDITTFTVDNPVAVALGAEPLDAEKSINYALGFVFRAGAFNLTVDGYRIDVEDRIVLSENLTAANVQAFLQGQGFIGSGGGRFFLNGVDTETQGVDIIANYAFPDTEIGTFRGTVGANFNKTEVTDVPAVPQLAALSPAPVLFGRVNVLTLEEGAPKDKFTGQLDWSNGPFAATLRAIRYGEVLVPSANPANDYTLDPKTVIDLEARYTWNDLLTLAVGADNILDEYPDAAPANFNGTGNTPFSSYGPFGYSGRFVYTKATLNF
ncbi:TonB-dependent receptor [Hyphomonas sp.]|uniref:TonB-dependent receptor plug domain-containing protein n=1 Tax=Hyphomonas sp. TaxID=87 RepID=UPI001BCED45A|nr:TonB-dependent receptor [Hyphomonas sp.]